MQKHVEFEYVTSEVSLKIKAYVTKYDVVYFKVDCEEGEVDFNDLRLEDQEDIRQHCVNMLLDNL